MGSEFLPNERRGGRNYYVYNTLDEATRWVQLLME
jgi:hypothetical protein